MMMRNRLLAGLIAAIARCAPAGRATALAQVDEREPPVGSPLRRQVLDGLRPTIERRLRGPVEFVVQAASRLGGLGAGAGDAAAPGRRARSTAGASSARIMPNMDGIEIHGDPAPAGMAAGGVVEACDRPDRRLEYCDPALGAPTALTDC